MLSYLLKILAFASFAIIVIFNYYSIPFHVETFQGYTSYVITLIILYSIYKYIQIDKWWNKVIFTPIKLCWLFILHLFVLSFLFFSIGKQPIWWGLILFMKIILFSIFPILTIFITTAFWKKLLSIAENFNIDIKLEEDNKIFNFITSLWIWFFAFLFFIAIFWLIGFYNLWVILSILIIFLWFWLKEFVELFSWLFSYKFEFDSHDFESDSFIKNISLNLLTAEFFFLVATFLLSVNLINIVRPFPIWWDDLWAYMNFPRLIANANSILNLWSIMSWQTFTWIGFLFNSPTLAFFLNNVWWFLSFIVISLATSDLLKSESKEEKTFINIPLLVSTIFISMPMLIFQQAKDMKLDPGLFFVSVIAIYLVYKVLAKYINHKDNEDFNHSQLYIYFLIIWILCWFAFTIKFTSLMLILWVIWVLFYSRLWLSWFFGYFAIFVSIFTKFKLWSMMNVVYPKDDNEFITNFSIWSFLVWIFFISYSLHKNTKKIKYFASYLSLLIFWIIIAISPWAIKNISSDPQNFSIWLILWWKSEYFSADYTKIYSKEQIKSIDKKQAEFNTISSSWKTQNEDMWRYFWYENWINNYIKLPNNLTMQSNQSWEFTDITYLYLALVPFLLLFLPYKNTYYLIATILFIGLELIFIFSNQESILSKYMNNITTPFWYIFILAPFIIANLLFSKWLKNNKLTEIFNLNIIFISIYVFLWVISAFWIVWYWISMYFSFLIIISICWYYLSKYNLETKSKEMSIKFFWSLILILLSSIYFFNSSFPHWFKNLSEASYNEFKTGKIWADESTFAYHPDYLKTLFELNIKKEKQNDFIINSISSEEIKNIIINNKYFDISTVERLLKQIESDSNTSLEMKNSAKKSRLNLYSQILNPKKEFKSDAIIYRLWTFLKYFISDNNKRLYEDSLISSFDLYVYNKDVDKTVDNMKKLWLSYLLVDLNAATIDQDPRHDLTRRYENLIKTYTSDNLELVDTDSICLQIWLEDYKKSEKKDIDMNNYIKMAWVNHESYTSSWKTISRWEKVLECYNKIINLIEQNKIDEKNYNYLLPFKQYLTSPENANVLKDQRALIELFKQYIRPGYKALFKIK